MKRLFTILALLAILVMVFPASAQTPALGPVSPAKEQAGVYLVRMIEDPVVAYEGGINGIPATRPGKGEKINPNSSKVKRYVTHLTGRHNEVLRAAGVDPKSKFYDYVYSLNGFAAVLTPGQVEALQTRPDVLTVWVDELRQKTTDNSPDFLGLMNTDGGLWADMDLTGEDIIVGVIDTGAWPEHPSFSDQVDLADRPGASGKRTRVYGPPPAHWYGTCQSGELWSQDDCNNKLIGARYFLDGFGKHGIIKHDYKSARDADGHGTHTASTAAGNRGVPATLLGVNRGKVSGMAPRARIAVYKALWNDEGGYTSDLAAAIDIAVADGVDVINYSIGGGSTSLLTADAVSFLFAADAGVFVATSAGNSGPGASTLGNPAVVPWLITVGASTQNRTFQGNVSMGDGSFYSGTSVTGGTDLLPLVDAVAAGSELCIPGALNPAVASGKIVLCKRGVNARVDKSLAVKQAGGLGMVLYNANDAQSQDTDNHWVPSVHINFTAGSAIKSYITAQGGSATAKITGGEYTPILAPTMADFSSRGPNGGAPDLIKPDITGPGVNILAGNTPTPFIGAPGELFQAIGGTSMSSPHVAGIGALVLEAHPDWSPAMVKSALMTTADPEVKKEDKITQAGPFDMGAGHLNPNPAVDPGLVYNAGRLEYLGFLCGSTNAVTPATCSSLASSGIPFDPSDLNLPSIGIAALAGSQTVVRTVKNVGPAGTYSVLVDAPAGIGVVVYPSTLPLASGESASYQVTFSRLNAALNQWTFGSLAWSDGVRSVRSPLAVRPVELAAPGEVFGTGTDGSVSYSIKFGYSGSFAALPHGLIPATTAPGNVLDDPANDINTALSRGVGVTFHDVTIPPETRYARFSLFDNYTDGNDDLDLYVFGPCTTSPCPQVGGSGSGTSAEEINLVAPKPGNYFVVVHGWGTDGPDANYTLFTWLLGDSDARNMTVSAPTAAVSGAITGVTVNWSGLAPGAKYLGGITYHNTAPPTGWTDGLIDFTILRVDTD